MHRQTRQPRLGWAERVAAVGLTYHSHEAGPYWDESACYELTEAEVELLERAGDELHGLYLEAAGEVIRRGWWDRLAIPAPAVGEIERSWAEEDFSLYGRFDLAFAWDAAAGDARSPKLLEYNADTPTALVEAAVAQWFWLQDIDAGADQFNSIHERLIEAWGRCKSSRIHFCGVREHPEDEQTVLYLRDTCEQAGRTTRGLAIDDVGWDERARTLVDLDGQPLECCFKLYPWEWLWAEEFGQHLRGSGTRFIEPPWKMLLSNKGMLPILWELFPGHPNLLPAYAAPEPLGGAYVRKPWLSREGSNVQIVQGGTVVEETDGVYGGEGHVYQAVAELPEFDGHRPIFGVWVVNHRAAGLGIREDTGRITGNLSRFIPHYFR